MIRNKSQLDQYLEEDRIAFNKPKSRTLKARVVDIFMPDYNYEFVRVIRKLEYWSFVASTSRGGQKLLAKIMGFRLQIRKYKLRTKTGIELHEGCCGPGIHIAHGKVVVHHNAKIGANCKLMSDVTIGINGRKDVSGVPVIGDRVFIGTGAKIIGPIHIADDVVIGANAVIVSSINEPGITVAGNPAKKVSDRGSSDYYLSAII